MNKYICKIEKMAKLNDEEKNEFSELGKEISSMQDKVIKDNFSQIGKVYGGIGGAGIGGNIALRGVRSGKVDGIVRRYHNTDSANVKSILENGLLSSNATNPDKNILTSVGAGISNDNMKGLNYLGKNRYIARGSGARRHQIKNLDKNLSPLEAMLKSFKDQKTMKINIPVEEYNKLNFVGNPEFDGAKTFREASKTQRGKLNPEAAYHLTNRTDVIKGDIASKFIKGGKGYKGQSIKGLANYIKNNPKMFAKGIAITGAGAGLAGAGTYGAIDGAKKIIRNNNELKEYANNNKEKITRYNDLLLKKFNKEN